MLDKLRDLAAFLSLHLFVATSLVAVALLALAFPALAQDAGGSASPSFLVLLSENWQPILLILLAAVALAQRVAAVIPGKRDDEIVGVVDGLLRKVVDFVGGVPKDPSDPGLVKKE